MTTLSSMRTIVEAATREDVLAPSRRRVEHTPRLDGSPQMRAIRTAIEDIADTAAPGLLRGDRQEWGRGAGGGRGRVRGGPYLPPQRGGDPCAAAPGAARGDSAAGGDVPGAV